jgi:uncharacterized protein DUF5675
MSVVSLNNGWMRFGNGRLWRCISPAWLCEVDRENNTPSFIQTASVLAKIRRVRAFYSGRVNMGALNVHGYGLDVLTANSMTESYGSAPTPFSYAELKNLFDNSLLTDPGTNLNEILNYVKIREKYLVRKEPGYVNPLVTPARVSAGAHHMLLETGIEYYEDRSATKKDKIKELCLKLPSESLFAADLAIKYFNRRTWKHKNQPPLLASMYNAGSLRATPGNNWGLVQYGNHIDRWIAYYNTSRLLYKPDANVVTSVINSDPVSTADAIPSQKKNLELRVVRKEFTSKSTIGEFYINEQFQCYTLEDVVREKGVKIFGETAIPKGRYEVIINESKAFHRKMPLLVRVPGYEGVRIHKGNAPEDTLGCILIGKNKSTDRIFDCPGVFDSFFKILSDFLGKGKCFITVS